MAKEKKEKKEKPPKLTKEEKQALKEEAKAEKERLKEEQRLEKLRAKAKKRGKRFDPNDPEWEDEEGGSLLIAIVAFMIILVWLGILCALVKLDVGGIGSTVLYPVLKDVPFINRILPGIEPELEKKAAEKAELERQKAKQKAVEEAKREIKTEQTKSEASPYSSMSEALAEIKKLQEQVDEDKKSRDAKTAEIADRQAKVEQLQSYKDDVDKFEEEKEKFYNEVVFSDEAPDINEYRKYYESIEPDNAEQIYRQIIEQQQADTKIQEYATTYSTMDSSEAAAIFDTMSKNLKLVSKILNAMSVEERSEILSQMDKENAARLTEIMAP